MRSARPRRPVQFVHLLALALATGRGAGWAPGRPKPAAPRRAVLQLDDACDLNFPGRSRPVVPLPSGGGPVPERLRPPPAAASHAAAQCTRVGPRMQSPPCARPSRVLPPAWADFVTLSTPIVLGQSARARAPTAAPVAPAAPDQLSARHRRSGCVNRAAVAQLPTRSRGSSHPAGPDLRAVRRQVVGSRRQRPRPRPLLRWQ
jgi:hypothetical protein